VDGEPDYKPRKARAASSSSESEEEGDDVDAEDEEDDSSARSNRNKNFKSQEDSAISKSSESAIDNNEEDNESSSDTEDEASKDMNEDDDDERDQEGISDAPVPMTRKVSVPADVAGELSKDEWELSKRETVNVDDAARKISAIEINEESDSDADENDKRRRTYSSSEDDEDVPAKKEAETKEVVARSASSSCSEDADTGLPIIVDANDVQPRANGGAEIRRPQFRHSASSLSDVEIQIPSSDNSPKHKIEERKQQLAAASQDTERPSSSQSPVPTRANADKITKMYTEAVGNNNDAGSASKQTERAKPTKDITSIYTQAMVKTSTPPASPKPVPSKNRGDITQLYTGGMTTKSPAGGVGSPCIVADKLSPKKHNMATAMDKDAIRQAYDDVRSDNSDTEW
jgi:hypothetical protein